MTNNQVYYDIRVKSEDGSKDYLIRMHVHEHFVDAIVASEQVRAEEGFRVYKSLSKQK